MTNDRGELFSMLLRLHPTEPGLVSPSSGTQVQAAFLDMVRQGDPTLAEWLHAPNQRRPYTLGLLQGFNHLSTAQLEEAMMKNQPVQVMPGQVYWLRITMLDASIFGSFAQYLIANPRALTVRIGNARFEISRLLSTPDPGSATRSWVAYSSFAELRASSPPQKHYHFEFATPTAFSLGQKVESLSRTGLRLREPCPPMGPLRACQPAYHCCWSHSSPACRLVRRACHRLSLLP